MKSHVEAIEETFGIERLRLYRSMKTYINHLEGAAQRGEKFSAPVLEADEQIISARLDNLPKLDGGR